MVGKQAYIEWREHSVTEEMKKGIQEAMESVVARIVTRQESNPMDDQYLKGLLRGFTEVLEWTPDLSNEEEE